VSRIAALHRWTGLALAMVLLTWTITGLLFHLKPGWSGAYEMLDPARPRAVDTGAVRPLPEVAFRVREATGATTAITGLTLFDTALGPLYRVTVDGRPPLLVDAISGRVLSPLTPDHAVALATDAAGRSSHPDRYGAVDSSLASDHEVVVRFAGGARVRVSRHTGAISQRGADTDRTDRLYQLHYLQLTGNPTIDRTVAVVAIAATWCLAILGIALFVRYLRSSRAR
jgi:uncharacterized iron-regulated membrane protein